MPWHARLDLDYRSEPANGAARSVARFAHTGPLRILQSLYPEGDGICHNVLVHPPGGLVGGDTLDIAITAAPDSHGLITTPGATRFYKSDGEPALQHTRIALEDNARIEWLPLEAICHSGCLAENRLRMTLAPTSELIGWDVTALGLPTAGQPFDSGSFRQHIELPGVWLERGRIDATDSLLMNGPLGLAGRRCMASIFFVAGSKLERHRRDQALEAARAVIEAHALHDTAAATSPNPQVVVVRALAPLVEPAMDLMRKVWGAWRGACWNMPAPGLRIWSM
ncbi:MAG: urease accessory protein UreD [Bdellovibrionales bacterium]|nr:urease accessory protein UreD [Ramlibacter sp.]